MTAKFETEALRIVLEDLVHVTLQWHKDIAEDVIRRDCAVLRRLLIDDHLGRAWRLVGFPKQPRILSPMLNAPDPKQVIFAQAGGANHHGVTIENLQWGYGEVPEEVLNAQTQHQSRRPLFLSEFLTSTCLVVNGTELSRHDLILYVANTLGGVHLDSDRTFKQNASAKDKFHALDHHFRTGETAGMESIYFELLSIGQSLANSKDIPILIKKIKQELLAR